MASAVGGARDGRGETPRTLETYPRVTSEPGGARGLFRGVSPPRARRRRRVRRDARQVARPRVRRGHLGARRGRVRGGRRGGDRVGEAKRRGRTGGARRRGVAGENGGGASGGGGGAKFRGRRRRQARRRRGLGESDDSGDEMDAAALHAARERKPEGYGNADIAAELAAELAAFFARAAGIRRLRNPRPSREDAARRALWRLKISNICSSARGPDTAWTPPRTGEKPRRRRSPRENRRGARGGTARRRFEHRRRLGSAPARARPARVSAPGRAVDAR